MVYNQLSPLPSHTIESTNRFWLYTCPFYPCYHAILRSNTTTFFSFLHECYCVFIVWINKIHCSILINVFIMSIYGFYFLASPTSLLFPPLLVHFQTPMDSLPLSELFWLGFQFLHLSEMKQYLFMNLAYFHLRWKSPFPFIFMHVSVFHASL